MVGLSSQALLHYCLGVKSWITFHMGTAHQPSVPGAASGRSETLASKLFKQVVLLQEATNNCSMLFDIRFI